ncbi:MAG: type II toxin-antitoxin system RelE/ParE family toxin [Rubrobacter sp.]|nr:type II toxin-antitoxin system RelE/ParE family toxin [Rubrobacter sp.]
MIRSFQDKETRRIWERRHSRAVPSNLQRKALRKLVEVNNAEDLNDLRVPPGNRLEKLSGDREGQHSIRINDRYRVCFEWGEGDAHQVEVVDYH